jgi:capsular exopolysaccharide synthesis family protein
VDVAQHFRTILENWWKALIVALVAAVAVYFVRSTRPKTYEGASLVRVVAASTQNTGDPTALDTVTSTYGQLAESGQVLTAGIALSKLPIDVPTARKRISVVAGLGLGVILIKGTGPSSKSAAALVSGTTRAFVDAVKTQQVATQNADLAVIDAEMRTLRGELARLAPGAPGRDLLSAELNAAQAQRADRQSMAVDTLDVLVPTLASSNPISPNPRRDAKFTFVLAFLLAAELFVGRAARRDRFSGTDEATVTRDLGLPVLARIPKGTGTETLEAFRVLRTNLMFLEGAGRPRTVAIVSSSPDAGKTFVAVHLAEAMASLDDRVVLVDADLRRPAVHERLGVDRTPGLVAVLEGADVATALRRAPGGGPLRVLPSGVAVGDPSGLLGARAFRQVLDDLRTMRLVVVDTPPAESLADTLTLASQCDAALFVLDMKTSRKRAVLSSIDALRRAGSNVVGVVVNRVPASRPLVELASHRPLARRRTA